MRNTAYRLAFGSADFVCAVGKRPEEDKRNLRAIFALQKKGHLIKVAQREERSAEGSSADGAIIRRPGRAVKLTLAMLLIARAAHCNEACADASGIFRTRMVRLDFGGYLTR
jgi:hypothetical protein